MSKKIKDMSRDEMEAMLESIHNEMYVERDNEAEENQPNTVVVRQNPDKEVNGGDLIDLVNDWFGRLRVRPGDGNVVDAEDGTSHNLEFEHDSYGCTIKLDGKNIGVLDLRRGLVTCYRLNGFGEVRDDGYRLD